MGNSGNKTVKVRRALLSVSDKTGIVDFAKKLSEMGIELISTGGTKKLIKESGIQVLPISSFTGAPEMLDGRVKTLHPAVHGGILFKRDNGDHVKQMAEQDMRAIDMVVVNLYPFEQTMANPDSTHEEIVEQIDIGGPSMIRSAAKNYPDVVVVTSPSTYKPLVRELESSDGEVSFETRADLSSRAFQLTARYDAVIAGYFSRRAESKAEELPDRFNPEYTRVTSLRYGENPHQSAAIYALTGRSGPSLVDAQVLAGKELSYNNYGDLEAVLEMILDFEEPFACVVKHANPCGAATAENVKEAYRLALDSDPKSAYGSIIGINRFVDIETAELLHQTQFVECILAPGYSDEALALMKKKKARRILALPGIEKVEKPPIVRYSFLRGGALAQDSDKHTVVESELNIVTVAKPDSELIESMLFSFQIVKHIKSNAIVLVQGTQTVGVGCGQTSRVDAVELAVKKAEQRAKNAVVGSDAFFPMRDVGDAAAEAGVKAIIQPGGSKRDDEAIEAANEHGIIMALTGIRHFKH